MVVKEALLTMERPKNRILKVVKSFAAKAQPVSDRLLNERVRLGIISALAVNPSLSFNDLKKLLNTTDGNLSVHARRLEEAGLVKCTKSFVDRMPKTEYKITESGRRALQRYLDEMEELITAVRKS